MSVRMLEISMSLLLSVALGACSVAPGVPGVKATVTGVTEGQGREMVYLLRTASGRTYVVSQGLTAPLRVGDVVEIEPGSGKESARIRAR